MAFVGAACIAKIGSLGERTNIWAWDLPFGFGVETKFGNGNGNTHSIENLYHRCGLYNRNG
jgi:hypothetical protein